jgi:hypothetical protein
MKQDTGAASVSIGQERQIIRSLAMELAEIANLPVQQDKIKLWKNLNGLKMQRPMVLVYAFPWDEAQAVSPELVLLTRDPFHQQLEQHLRRLLYKWRYMRADMVVQPVYKSPVFVRETRQDLRTGGMVERSLSYCTNLHTSDIGRAQSAKAYEPVLRNEDDIAALKMPLVEVDSKQTEEAYERSCDLLEPILRVEKTGVQMLPFAPMDTLMELWGIEPLMIDMIERPHLIHLAMEKLVAIHLSRLDQFIKLNILAANHDSAGAITQGMGECFTDELPGQPFDPAAVRPQHMWGGATAQIFSSVSPEMHAEFALQHEIKWLECFGLAAYGCCEPLDRKIGILRQVKNLRKISMSSWIRTELAAAEVGRDFVFSYKPKPTFLALDDFNLEPTLQEMKAVLQHTQAHSCPLEFILRTIISFRQDPRRITEWVKMAMSLVGAE